MLILTLTTSPTTTSLISRSRNSRSQAYFQGRLKKFDLPLADQGTPFQKEVWRALLTIPFGQTRTYAELAGQIGRPRAFRAVGAANGRNPISIVVPCHRVIGSDGSLTGFGGGLALKQALLDHEAGRLSDWPGPNNRPGLNSPA